MPPAVTVTLSPPAQGSRRADVSGAWLGAEPRRVRFAWLPSLLALAMAAVGWAIDTPWHSPLGASLLGATVCLVAWNGVLLGRRGRATRLAAAAEAECVLALRKQHYLQACAQGAVLAYWGWYWRPVYDFAPLILAQLFFAYAFDMLLAWSRRRSYTLGFGPVPVVFSTNLFLWFERDWFFLQLIMLAVGFSAKALIVWTREGRLVHVFNPSSFPLALVSLVLIVTGAHHLTRGQEIAITQFYPPQMYLVLFLVGLPGQFFFGVASMTLAAVVTTALLGFVYFLMTGTYFFYDAYVPIAVFLGMHLLFTDPSTAPRTELGRLAFGVLYGASSMVLYQGLTAIGAPAFYDKLLQVPLLNLSVRWLDRVSSASFWRGLDPARLGRVLTVRQRSMAYMVLWGGVFALLSALQGVGDRHPGQWVRFWEVACQGGRPRACTYLSDLEQRLCEAGSGWACNEAGLRLVEGGAGGGGQGVDVGRSAVLLFQRGCRLGFIEACTNIRRSVGDSRGLERGEPTLADYPILVRGSKGPVVDRQPATLLARACAIGWPSACDRAGASR